MLADAYTYAPYTVAIGFVWGLLQVASPILARRLFGSTYEKLDQKDKMNWDMRFVGAVHAVVASILAPFVLVDAHLSSTPETRLFATNTYAFCLSLFSSGYFLWDLYVSIRYYGFGFIVHGIACFALYWSSLRPFCSYYAGVFLLYELSTPFVHNHWFMTKLGYRDTAWFKINGAITIILFFLVRLVFGLYQSYIFWSDCLWAWHDAKVHSEFAVYRYVASYFLTANIVLNCLNLFWFYSMIKVAFFPGKKEYYSSDKVE